MSDESVESLQPAEKAGEYQPPKVTPVGNVRDILAGGFGTQPDGDDPDQTRTP